MDITIRDKKKYSVFKVKANRFVIRNKWKMEMDIDIGDYVIITDYTESVHFLLKKIVIGYTRDGKIVVQGTANWSAFNNARLSMDQCQKWNPEVHTSEWKRMLVDLCRKKK